MSSQTNVALNSRSMNGIITVSDGSAILENGTLTCNNINTIGLNLSGGTISGLTSLAFTPSYPDSTTKISTTAFVSNNFVDKTTDQPDIAGQKTFTTGISTSLIKSIIGTNIFKDFSITTTPIPTNSLLAGLATGWNQQGFGETDFISYGAGDTTTGGFHLSCVNRFNNNQWLAKFTKSSIVFYKELYIFGNSINNLTSLSVSPTYPNSTTQIATTEFVSLKFVDKTTDQTIEGNKTFTDACSFNNTLQSIGQFTIGTTAINGLTELYVGLLPTYPNSSNKIVNTSYLSNYVNIDTTQTITGQKTFNTITSFLQTVSSGNIVANNIVETYNFYLNMTTGSLSICAGLTEAGFLRLATTASQIYLDGKTQLRSYMNLFEAQSASSNVTLTWPLSQTVNLKGSINYTVTLPIITSNQEGMQFIFCKTLSITMVITLTTQGTNVIQYSGSLTQYTSENLLLSNGLQSTTLICVQVGSTGIYAWQEQTPIYSFYKAITNLQSVSQTLIGSILAFLYTPVDTYLVCDGTSYLKATYLQLWNVIGYSYGGSGLNFNVPDYRGLFLRGLGTNATNINYVGGALGTLQTDIIKNHTHNFGFASTTGIANIGIENKVTTINTSGANIVTTTNNASGSSSETRPGNQSVIWCIRYV
jgi:microcystin-dependent protein